MELPIVRDALTAFVVCLLFALQGTQAHATGKAAVPAEPPHYALVDLGAFQAREIDERPSLNSRGHVAAWQILGQVRANAVLYDAGGGQLIAGTPEERNSFGFGINSSDTVVGIFESRDDLRDSQAFEYQNGQLRVLPTLGGKYAAARSVNSHGVIVGNARTAADEVHAVSWSEAEIRDLGTLPGGDFSRALQINDSGDIAGEANTRHNGKTHAVLWSNGHIQDLGLLPGGSFSSAQAVNGKHVAVGFADAHDGGGTAVRFANGHVAELGSLGDDPSSALGINDRGQIVGSAAVAEGKMRAFLWENGVMHDLNKLLAAQADWVLMAAYQINARGQILAYGFHAGSTHACLLTPVTLQ